MMRRASEDLSDPSRNLAESLGSHDVPTDDQDITEGLDPNLTHLAEGQERIFNPPPHIMARFYRASATRRKSSTASSRRNSVSSAHSHQSLTSGRSFTGRSQSDFIDGNLRRNSLIESRKARLADRAAHAEKVRLRAALAKATNAATKRATTSEERALAAKQAREKNLAEIVANCAEEVKRAKMIAESMKEKRAAEGARLRKEMEERLAEAERRREEILAKSFKRSRSGSAPRKASSPTPSPKPVDEETAARRIQQRWRAYCRWKVMKDFTSLGLSIDGVRETSFEQVVDLLAQERVLLSTAQMLRLCGLQEGEKGSVNEMTAVRTFLSAYLILGHPAQVLSNKGAAEIAASAASATPMPQNDLTNPQLQELVGKARDLLISFENIVSRLSPTNNYTAPPVQQTTLSEAYATFHNAFISWKARDSSALIDMMVMQFVELDSIWQKIKDSTEEHVAATYRDGIRENQLKLMVRIKRLAGPAQAKKLIANAIREARKSLPKPPTGDSKPRAAEAGPKPPVLEDLNASHHAVTTQMQTVTPPPTPPRASASKSRSDDLRTAVSIMPGNRTLVHELLINKEYRIEMGDCSDQRGATMKMIFDAMRQEINSGNTAAWVLAMAENIKGKLQHLLQPGNSMHTLIGEALDTDVVSRELHNGSFSYEKFFSFMASLLPRLCAPIRDNEAKALVESLSQNNDVVDRLETLMHFIDLMQLDYANFMLQQSAPELIKHAVPYEHKRFAENLERGAHTLEMTEKWWKAASAKVLADLSRRDPEGINHPKNKPMPDRFYINMLTDVFTDLSRPATIKTIPETLQLDSKRISRTRVEILRIVTGGAILLQCKSLLKRDVRSLWKTEAQRILKVLENAPTPESAIDGVQAALESCHAMPAATKAHMRTFVSRILSASFEARARAHSGNGVTLGDPVMRLLLTRLRNHLLGRLTASTASEKVRATSGAGESLASLGLPEFVSVVGKMVEEMSRVGVADRDAHSVWYDAIASKIAAELQAEAQGEQI